MKVKTESARIGENFSITELIHAYNSAKRRSSISCLKN